MILKILVGLSLVFTGFYFGPINNPECTDETPIYFCTAIIFAFGLFILTEEVVHVLYR